MAWLRCSMVSSGGKDQEDMLVQRLERLESEVEEKEMENRRRVSDLRKTYDTEAARIR